MKYVEDMNCVIAGSLDKFVSMTDVEQRVPLKVLDGHTKGEWNREWAGRLKRQGDRVGCGGVLSLSSPSSLRPAVTTCPLARPRHSSGVTTVDWSPIYKFVCSGSQDKNIILWNPFSQKPLATLSGHNGMVHKVLVNDKNNQVRESVARVWTRVRGRLVGWATTSSRWIRN